ncbi:hypothetical protein PTKIN_Ptkin01aG0149500 [Pterospermum kingtungense]
METQVQGLSLFDDDEAELCLKVGDDQPEECNFHMCLVGRLSRGDVPNFMPLFFVNSWVQIFDLLVDLMKLSIGKQLGNYIGEFLEYDASNNSMFWRSLICIRVKVDVHKPLEKKKKISCHVGVPSIVSFKYKRLINIYFICGLLGHTERGLNLEGERWLHDSQVEDELGSQADVFRDGHSDVALCVIGGEIQRVNKENVDLDLDLSDDKKRRRGLSMSEAQCGIMDVDKSSSDIVSGGSNAIIKVPAAGLVNQVEEVRRQIGFEGLFQWIVWVEKEGYKFTWAHSLGTDDAVEEQLDRAIGNLGWLQLFPNARLSNLVALISDHTPLLLETDVAVDFWGKRKFQFENSLLREPNLFRIAKEE